MYWSYYNIRFCYTAAISKPKAAALHTQNGWRSPHCVVLLPWQLSASAAGCFPLFSTSLLHTSAATMTGSTRGLSWETSKSLTRPKKNLNKNTFFWKSSVYDAREIIFILHNHPTKRIPQLLVGYMQETWQQTETGSYSKHTHTHTYTNVCVRPNDTLFWSQLRSQESYNWTSISAVLVFRYMSGKIRGYCRFTLSDLVTYTYTIYV